MYRFIRPDGTPGFRDGVILKIELPERATQIGVINVFKNMIPPLVRPLTYEQSISDMASAIRWVQSRGIRVILMPVPFNPWVNKQCDEIVGPLMRENIVCEGMKSVMEATKKVAAESGALFAGGTDGRPFGMTSDDFHDFWHVWYGGWRKIPDPVRIGPGTRLPKPKRRE